MFDRTSQGSVDAKISIQPMW